MEVNTCFSLAKTASFFPKSVMDVKKIKTHILSVEIDCLN